MPFVHQYIFGVRPDRLDLWIPHAHNNLSVMARQPGLFTMRLYRWRANPDWWFSLRVWRSKEYCDRALATPEVRLATSTNPKHQMSEGYQGSQRSFELLDHTFGRTGLAAFLT